MQKRQAKMCETILLSRWNDLKNNGQCSGQSTLTNKVIGACEEADFDFNEFVNPKTWETKKNLSSATDDWNKND